MKTANIARLERMLQPVRFRQTAVTRHATDGRTPFDSDFARVALSAPVRRLQDKTQVFPLSEYDFVRNRLTHSLEVMTMARGIGLGVEKMLAAQGLDLIERNAEDPLRNAISKTLEVAALVHDLGNPPFGHQGEKAIQHYFRTCTGMVGEAVASLGDTERADLQHIEGNAQGLRILRHLALAKDGYSYNLTMPVLATIIKYPCSSVDGNKNIPGEPFRKKFGFLTAEAECYTAICRELGLTPGQRHPLTFLLEAADDITYHACDLEDGFRNGIISISTIKQHIDKGIAGLKDTRLAELSERLDGSDSPLENEVLIQELRIAIQSEMIIACTERFVQNIDKIIDGTCNSPLLEDTAYCALSRELDNLDLANFTSEQVRGKETEGINKLLYLLNGYAKALVLLNEGTDPSAPEYQLYNTISHNYRKAACDNNQPVPSSLYRKLLLLTDFFFGMTDRFVLNLYNDDRVRELILRVKCKADIIQDKEKSEL